MTSTNVLVVAEYLLAAVVVSKSTMFLVDGVIGQYILEIIFMGNVLIPKTLHLNSSM